MFKRGKRLCHFRFFPAYIFILSALFPAAIFAGETACPVATEERRAGIQSCLAGSGLNSNGVDPAFQRDIVTSDSKPGNRIVFLRYELPERLQITTQGVQYNIIVGHNADHEISPRVRLVDNGETYAGTKVWKTDASVEGRLKLGRLFALAYRAENSHPLAPVAYEQELTGGTLSGVLSPSNRFSLTGGGSIETLTNYTQRSAGYYNLRLSYNSLKSDFTLEGLWGSSDRFVDMRDLSTVGAQTYSGLFSYRF